MISNTVLGTHTHTKTERVEGFKLHKADHMNQNRSTGNPGLRTEC